MLFRGSFLSEGDKLADGSLLMIPPVDLYETPDCYVLSAELPGVESEDVHVEVRGSELSIWGERKVESVLLRRELSSAGGAEGTLLPDVCHSRKPSTRMPSIKATLRDGVLQVALRKSAKRKNIKIQVPQDGR